MTIPGWVHVAEPAALAELLISRMQEVVADAVTSRGRWTLAIPGGSVAEAMLPPLGRARFPWGAADVFWCDERAVPPDDPLSNWGLCQRLWDSDSLARAATLHRMPAERPDRLLAVAEYQQDLESRAGRPAELDVVLLGVGEDGHVASIFPGRPGGDRAPVFVEEQAAKVPPVRMSLSLSVLARARLTCVVAFGAGKADAVRHALDAASGLPVAQLLRMARTPLLLLDKSAAAGVA